MALSKSAAIKQSCRALTNRAMASGSPITSPVIAINGSGRLAKPELDNDMPIPGELSPLLLYSRVMQRQSFDNLRPLFQSKLKRSFCEIMNTLKLFILLFTIQKAFSGIQFFGKIAKSDSNPRFDVTSVKIEAGEVTVVGTPSATINSGRVSFNIQRRGFLMFMGP